jgi:nicotinamidase-related amidase
MHGGVVANVKRLVEATCAAGLPVLWSRQEHDEDDRGRLGHRFATHTEKGGYLPCIRGTWDAEILDELRPLVRVHDTVIVKHRASCFYSTKLEVALRMGGVDTLIVAGVSTNYCVDSTIRDAYARDFDLVVVEDACGAIDRGLHEATIKNAALFHGAVVTTAIVVDALRGVLGSKAAAGGGYRRGQASNRGRRP